MRRMISETKAKVLDNLVVNKDGTVIEVDGNVAVESPAQLGHYVDKYNRVKCVIVDVIGTNDPVVLVEGITHVECAIDVWAETTNIDPSIQIPPVEEGQIVYVQGDKMFYKLNGKTYYSETDDILLCDGTITEPWGRKWQEKGYIQEGGRIFQPLFAEPKLITDNEIRANNDYRCLWLEDVVSPQIYRINSIFPINTMFNISSLDGPITVVLGDMLKGAPTNPTNINSCLVGIFSVGNEPTGNGYATIEISSTVDNIYIIVNNRFIYVDMAYEV